MKISNFKYILTDIGGGWGYNHILYGVTPNGEVYTTKEFNDSIFQLDSDLECEYLGKLDNIELGLKDESELHFAVMDASDLTIYEVGKTYKMLHFAPLIEENNPKIYKAIYDMVVDNTIHVSVKHEENGDFLVGEVKSPELFKHMQIISGGHPVLTTFHARDCHELVEKLKEEIMGD